MNKLSGHVLTACEKLIVIIKLFIVKHSLTYRFNQNSTKFIAVKKKIITSVRLLNGWPEKASSEITR